MEPRPWQVVVVPMVTDAAAAGGEGGGAVHMVLGLRAESRLKARKWPMGPWAKDSVTFILLMDLKEPSGKLGDV